MFFYECDEFKDAGWGCCYRSFQNLLGLYGCKLSMKDLFTRMGGDLSRNPRLLWREPAEFIKCVPERFVSFSYLWVKTSDDIAHMLRTTPGEYVRLHGDIQKVVANLVNLFGAVLLDNGIYAYCLWREGKEWKLADPHVFRRDKVVRTLPNLAVLLLGSPCWMLLSLGRH